MTINSIALGIENPKTPENMGIVLRAAGCYEAQAIYYTGERYKRAKKFFTDTKNIASKIPVVGVDNLLACVPDGAKIIAIELVEGALPLTAFEHPDNAYYLFGPEDGSLSQALLNQCDSVVYIPTIGCMNLAATVNVVLYDRLAKRSLQAINDRPIVVHRDTNNKTKI